MALAKTPSSVSVATEALREEGQSSVGTPTGVGQMLVMRLFREHDIMTQICWDNFMVRKVASPLNSKRERAEIWTRCVRE